METRTQISTSSLDELQEFVYATSHDLRAPLRAIENISHWIEEDLASDPSPELDNHLRLMRLRLKRMNQLLDDLLAYSRAGSNPDKIVEVNLNDLFLNIVKALPPRQGIRVDIDADLPVLQASGNSISQVLTQLISNGMKHHDKMTGQVRISAKNVGHAVEITVQDDGPGINPRDHERIFKICQTLKSKEDLAGSGVGLALVKRILERHGGTISLDSSPGRGSIFCVTWPQGA